MKLKAFTILELMVTLILSSLTIAFAIAVLKIIISMHTNYKEKATEIADLELLRVLMNRDINNASYVKSEGTAFICFQKEKEVTYKIKSDYLIRIQESKQDTFFFDQLELELINMNAKSSLVEIINIKGEIRTEKYEVSFYKDYDALSKIKIERNGYSY